MEQTQTKITLVSSESNLSSRESAGFYSQQQQVIDDNLTYFNSQKVFTGQYWDEFALVCSLVPDNADVLMLGLARGGGIRPILSSTKNIHLHCLDIDEKSMDFCNQFYKQNFPQLKFETTVADALTYLVGTDRRYHAIWIDIYEDGGYSSLCFEPEFMRLVRSRLTPDGVLLANAYGLPNQFSPLKQLSAQRKFAQQIAAQFDFVGAVPFRRNITLIAANQNPHIHPARASTGLNSMDQISFQIVQNQLAELSRLDLGETIYLKPTDFKFQTIDTQMRSLWAQVREALGDIGIYIESNQDILPMIQSPDQGFAVADYLLAQKSSLLSFLPILAAGQSHCQSLEVDWLFQWTFANAAAMELAMPALYRQIWLPQMWALVVHPTCKYKQHYFQMLALLRTNIKASEYDQQPHSGC